MDATCIVLPKGVDNMRNLGYSASMGNSLCQDSPGNRRRLRAYSQPGRPEPPRRLPRGSMDAANKPNNALGGRLTPSADYAIQIMLATWALRELTAQRERHTHRGRRPTP